MTQTNTKEDTSCKSNSTIEPAPETTDIAANDNKPSPTGNNNTTTDDGQVQNDPVNAAHTDNKVCTYLYSVDVYACVANMCVGYSSS